MPLPSSSSAKGSTPGSPCRSATTRSCSAAAPTRRIRLDDDYVSTRHARFVPHGEDWYVEDLGSTNGTYIGSQRITAPMVVAIGVQVRLGKTIAELKK